MQKRGAKDSTEVMALVGVLKSRQDLQILRKKHWYRIPLLYLPRKPFQYLALYEPARIGGASQSIRYIARIKSRREVLRKVLFPKEKQHPRANDLYAQFICDRLIKLPQPIKNLPPRRVIFGFVPLRRLVKAKNMLALYKIFPAEQVIGRALGEADIKAVPQYHLTKKEGQYCLDFAIFCNNGKVAIECDNEKAHRGKQVHAHDLKKDQVLRQNDWTVIRLKEFDIISNPQRCLRRVQQTIRKLRGLKSV